jgi:hypothetical protein
MRSCHEAGGIDIEDDTLKALRRVADGEQQHACGFSE